MTAVPSGGYPDWATDANYSGGGPTKVAPSAGRVAQGWEVLQQPPAQFFNWWKNLVSQWIRHLKTELADSSIKCRNWSLHATTPADCWAGLYAQGTYFFVGGSGRIYDSTDLVTFNNRSLSGSPPPDLAQIAASYDGTEICCVSPSALYGGAYRRVGGTSFSYYPTAHAASVIAPGSSTIDFFAGGASGYFCSSVDGGQNWTTLHYSTGHLGAYTVYDIASDGSGRVCVTIGYPQIATSADNGTSFALITATGQTMAYNVIDVGAWGWVAVAAGEQASSADGIAWTSVTNNLTSAPNSIASDGAFNVVTCADGSAWYTRVGTATWSQITPYRALAVTWAMQQGPRFGLIEPRGLWLSLDA